MTEFISPQHFFRIYS